MRWLISSMSRTEIVRCARERFIVELDDGQLGKLVRWDTLERPGTARVELRPGKAITVPIRRVRAVLLGESPETRPEALRIDDPGVPRGMLPGRIIPAPGANPGKLPRNLPLMLDNPGDLPLESEP